MAALGYGGPWLWRAVAEFFLPLDDRDPMQHIIGLSRWKHNVLYPVT